MSNIGKKLTAVTAVCLLGAAGLWFASTPLREALQEDVQTMPSAKTGDPLDDTGAPVSAGTQPDAQDAQAVFQPLFPGLESASIQAVSINTPESEYYFQCEGEESVSVNNHMADDEVFDTLIEQILAFSFEQREPFSPQESPVLTIAVFTEKTQYNASFYPDGDTGKNTNIICGLESSPQYLTTEAWRVGTLLLTCEGTRILDESGKETPAE